MKLYKPKHRVESLIIHPNSYSLHRVSSFKIEKGKGKVLIENLEEGLDVSSFTAFFDANVSILDVKVFKTRVDAFKLDIGEIGDILSRFLSLKDKLKTIENKIEGLRKLIEVLDGAGDVLAYHFVSKIVSGEDPSKVYGGLFRARDWLVEEAVKLEGQAEGIKAELESLRGVIGFERYVNVSNVELTICSETDGDVNLEFFYNVPGGGWKAQYDIIADDDSFQIMFYGLASQKTALDWTDVDLKFTTRIIESLEWSEPQPWIVNVTTEEAKPAAPKLLALAFKERPEEARRGMVEATVEGELYQTYSVKGKVSLHYSKPYRFLLERKKVDGRILYVWDAFTSLEFLKVLEFTNKDTSLIPGEYKVLINGLNVATGRMRFYRPNERVKIPIEKATILKGTKRLVERVDETKGIVKDKMSMRLGYELKVENYGEKPLDVEVYDRIPVIKHPKVKVNMTHSTIRPEVLRLGILRWRFTAKPGVNLIRYSFRIEYPPEIRIPI